MLARVCIAIAGLLLQPTVSIRTGSPRSQTSQDQLANRSHDLGEGARIVMYYVLLEENSKHSVDEYVYALQHQCKALQHEIDNGRVAGVEFVGSVGWLAENVPSCVALLSDGARELSLAEMPLSVGDYGGRLWKNCSLKYDRPGDPPFPYFESLVKIWLNKLSLTCESAERHPDEVTMFTDVNLFDRPDVWELAMKAPSNLHPGRLGMQNREDSEIKRPAWFGQEQCSSPPHLRAKYIAVRGRDCKRLMSEFLDSMKEVVTNPTCGCWDEEMIFARMYTKNPDLFDTGS